MREVASALADMDAACQQLDVTVSGIAKQHDPFGCLPFLLATASAAIVAVVMARSVRWYFVVLVSLGAASVMWIVLMFFRVAGWLRHHPMLAALYKLQHLTGRNEDAEYDRIDLSEAIVRRYLPEEGEPLLARLDDTRQRTARLLGLDEEVGSSRSGVGG
jgi:hypothetical protein